MWDIIFNNNEKNVFLFERGYCLEFDCVINEQEVS